MEKWGIRRLNPTSIVAGRSKRAPFPPRRLYSAKSKPTARPTATSNIKQIRQIPLLDTAQMTTTIEVATVPSADTPGTCLYVHHEKRTYIFGRVAEGTQRAFGSRKIRLPSTSQIFLSGPVDWSQMGGVLGYILTVGGSHDGAVEGRAHENRRRKEAGRKQLGPIVHGGLGIHGGENLCHSLAACRHIIFRHSIGLKMHEHRTDPRAESPTQLEPDWSDESIRVWKIPVRRAQASSSPPKRPFSAIDESSDDDGGQGEKSTSREGGQDESTKQGEIQEGEGENVDQEEGKEGGKEGGKEEGKEEGNEEGNEGGKEEGNEEGNEEGKEEGKETKAAYKTRSTLSDPEVTAFIVERLMFTGCSTEDRDPKLIACTLGELQPGDAAIVAQDGVLRSYKGPYSSGDSQVADAATVAWRLPRYEAELREKGTKVDTLSVTQHKIPPTSYSETSMSYIMLCQDRRGKFDMAAAKALGVAPTDAKFLTWGQSVTGKGGMTVTPDMVLGPPQPGRGIVVADIPSVDWIEAFVARPEWQQAALLQHVVAMYWIVGAGVAGDARIQAFVAAHSSMRHVFCAPDTCPNRLTHTGMAEMQVKLRQIDSARFPLVHYDNAVAYPAPAADSPVELGRSGARTQLMPRLVHTHGADDFHNVADAKLPAEFRWLAREARAEAASAATAQRAAALNEDMPSPDTEVVALGTGSSVPSKYRNVSATLVRVPGCGNYLLDCGEGTLGQLHRAFGPAAVPDELAALRCIVISHMHADHHMGAISVIHAWYRAALRRNDAAATLTVSCIGRFRQMLEELAQLADFGLARLRFPHCPRWPHHRDIESVTNAAAFAPDARLLALRRIPVNHCWRAHAVELHLTSGLRIAYSGDCRPSRAFALACYGAHLLVHECTFDNDHAVHAAVKKHCTLDEALDIAAAMDARRTLLTHFSQRYTKSGSLHRRGTPTGSVLLAFDLMRVRLADFAQASCYVPAIQKLMQQLSDTDVALLNTSEENAS